MNSELSKKLSYETSLNSAEIKAFLSCMKTVVLDKGELLLKQNNYAHHLAFLNSGLLMAYNLSNKGVQRVTQIAFEGDWTTDLASFYSGNPSQFTIEATEKCEVLLLSKTDFNELCTQNPKIERFFRLLAEEAYVYSVNRIMNIYNEDAAERYKILLQEHPNIHKRLKQQDIASYLGIEAPSLSRILKGLK